MNRFGTDRPDLRFDLELSDFTELAKSSNFTVFKNAINDGAVIKALRLPQLAIYSRKQIEEWEGTNSPEPVVEEASPEPESLMEAPSSKAIDDMSKRELEDLGRQHGIELDRRRSKSDLVQELNDAGIN